MANQLSAGHLINSSGADNMSASITSSWVNVESSDGFSLEIKVDNTSTASTGTAAGTIGIQVSNSGVNWTNIELSGGGTTFTVSSGADLDKFFSDKNVVARYSRVVYTRSSGDGIIDVYFYISR